MKAKDLRKDEYLPFFQPYINTIGDVILLQGLEDGLIHTLGFLKSIPSEKLEYRYKANKWTIKEIVNHLIDSERVFAYRALRFARQDNTPVAGFDENNYATESLANSRAFKDILEEYKFVRQASIALYKTFGADSNILKRTGLACGGSVSVRALGFLIAGHEKHHCNIIKERYL